MCADTASTNRLLGARNRSPMTSMSTKNQEGLNQGRNLIALLKFAKKSPRL